MRVRTLLTIAIVVVLAVVAIADEKKSKAVSDDELGLSKTSVFDTPTPIVPGSAAQAPGENEPEEAYFPEAPPVIPHELEDFIPIRIGENMCLTCHELPDAVGKPVEQGDPTPIPLSHYAGPETVRGTRFVCTQCHVTQTNAKPPVGNTYRQ